MYFSTSLGRREGDDGIQWSTAIVEKEETLVLSRIIHRNQDGTWLGKGSIKKF